MKSLLEIFDECKKDEKLQDKTLIVIDSENIVIFNAKVLDPYLGALILKDIDIDKDVAITYTSLEASKVQAYYVD